MDIWLVTLYAYNTHTVVKITTAVLRLVVKKTVKNGLGSFEALSSYRLGIEPHFLSAFRRSAHYKKKNKPFFLPNVIPDIMCTNS